MHAASDWTPVAHPLGFGSRSVCRRLSQIPITMGDGVWLGRRTRQGHVHASKVVVQTQRQRSTVVGGIGAI